MQSPAGWLAAVGEQATLAPGLLTPWACQVVLLPLLPMAHECAAQHWKHLLPCLESGRNARLQLSPTRAAAAMHALKLLLSGCRSTHHQGVGVGV